ncbi:HK97 family phage prohead protease [Streptomyces africanus]|uniref:HK97 family phage prohead protease n=1 Tax=Streptomyces africanus TaxID=231024 RepID=A0ABU0QHN9_9ACTN|nr:HK97 family phage prohead protease [Streptomyces africanus]MDQ0746900.1 HK97 family phage prohead protease [Streptomyces africanus]
MLETRQFVFRADTEGDGRTLSGVVVPYSTRADIHENGRDFTEQIAPGACRDAAASGGVPILWAHDRSQVPIATATNLEERDDGLHMTARLLTHPLADAVREGVAEGAVRGASIGFSVPEGGDEWRGDERVIHRLQLREISITSFPAYVTTGVGVRSADAGPLTAGARAHRLRELALRAYAPPTPALDAPPSPSGADAPTEEDAADALAVLDAYFAAMKQGDGSGEPPPLN